MDSLDNIDMEGSMDSLDIGMDSCSIVVIYISGAAAKGRGGAMVLSHYRGRLIFYCKLWTFRNSPKVNFQLSKVATVPDLVKFHLQYRFWHFVV